MKTNINYVWITETVKFIDNDEFRSLGIISVDKDPKNAIQWAISQGAYRTYAETDEKGKITAIIYRKHKTMKGYTITRHMVF